jgi:TatD DNase family protein
MSTSPSYIDIGVNLTDDMFSGHYHGRQAHPADLDLVMQRAQKAGVIKQMVTVGQLNEIKPALELTKQFEGLYCTAGVHPTRASQLGQDNAYLDELRSVLNKDAKSPSNQNGKIIAIGECGLDYDRLHFSSKEDQLRHFELQLQLAKEYKLPLFLHCRAAHTDFVNILQRYLAEAGEGAPKERKHTGVVHCFTGSIEEMTELVDMGFFIGLTGCSLKNEEGLQVAKQIPLDKLLLETDAPWCDMRPTHASASYWSSFTTARPDLALLYQPASAKKEKWDEQKTIKGRNEPCAIGCIAAVIAHVKGVTIEEVASSALDNARYLLGV